MINWAAERTIFFTRSRPYKKNDQATIESKNGHLVRRYAFYYRYDTADELAILNRLWPLVNDRLNYLTPTKKPIGFGTDAAGRRKRLYDKPATPLDRLLAAKVLSPEQQTELIAYRDRLNPAAIATQIADLQTRLLVLAKDKTEQLHLASFPTALPDVRNGIRVKKARQHHLNGRKILVAGNHDSCWTGHRRAERAKRSIPVYLDAGFAEVHETGICHDHCVGNRYVVLSHLPYAGDHTETDRYADRRPRDEGLPLVCGHVHNAWRIQGRQVNVGVDVWDYSPVSETTLARIIAEL